MPRLGEKFTFELTWQEQLGLDSVVDPRRQDLADRPRVTEAGRTEQRQAPADRRHPQPHSLQS